MTTSIFDEKNKVNSPFFSFKKIGDKVEGTLIDKRVVMNKLSGKEQIVYDIRTPDESYYTVGGKPGIDSQMKRVALGQIVGFEFVAEKKNTGGLDPTKIIQVYANRKIVDEEWIKERDETTDDNIDIEEAFGNKPTQMQDTVGEDSEPEHTVDGYLEEIKMLATAKLGVKNDEELKSKVMEATGLAFIDANLEKLIEVLKDLPDSK